MYELPSEGRRLSTGLIVMLVVLAAVAGTMGYLVARQVIDGRNSPNGTGAQPSATGPEPDVSTSTPGTDPATDTPTTTSTQTRGPDLSNPNDGESCPKPTVDAVTAGGLNGELTLVVYIEFNVERGPARAWICKNADDVLIYQAHERFGPFDLAFNGENTLLLAKDIKGDVVAVTGGFLAHNPDDSGRVTEYTVTREALTIKRPSGITTVHPATKVLPPG